jgi:predicted nucleic acid-binding protein
VVSDTTAVTTLLKVGRADWLADLFGQVLIPAAVERELRQHHDVLPACCAVRRVADSERLRRLLAQADPGEAEAICLAVETNAQVLLIDDKKGRRLAEAEGVRCLGLPALVLAATNGGSSRRSRLSSTRWNSRGTTVCPPTRKPSCCG